MNSEVITNIMVIVSPKSPEYDFHYRGISGELDFLKTYYVIQERFTNGLWELSGNRYYILISKVLSLFAEQSVNIMVHPVQRASRCTIQKRLRGAHCYS